MNKDKRNLIGKISRDAVNSDWELAFGGKSYGNRHLFRVNKIAKYLHKKEGGDEFVVLTGGWLHDVALATGSDYDSERVENETRIFVESYGEISEVDKKRIVECAVGHESNGEKLTTEASIVHDADALDKCGALGVIRHIWKTTNMLENRVLFSKSDFVKLKTHLLERQTNLITDTAKKLAIDLNDKGNAFFDHENEGISLMEKISTLAMAGKTTDKIAKILLKEDKSAWKSVLRDQIECKYLKKY